MIVWLGLALAGGFTHRTTREPLPARWLERPVLLPAGWKQVDVWTGGGAVGAHGRLSLGPAVELRAAVATDDRFAPSTVGAALRLGRAEAPARSAALELSWQVPQLGADPEQRIQLGLPVRRQWGGSRWTAGPLLDAGTFGAGAGVRGEAGLQAGPLGFLVDGSVRYGAGDLSGVWTAGGFLQLNRALRVHLERVERRDPAPVRPGVDAVLGLELSL